MSLINLRNGHYNQILTTTTPQYLAQNPSISVGQGTSHPIQMNKNQINRYWFAAQQISLDMEFDFFWDNIVENITSGGHVSFSSGLKSYTVRDDNVNRSLGIGSINGIAGASNSILSDIPLVHDRILNGFISQFWTGTTDITVTDQFGNVSVAPNQIWGASLIMMDGAPQIDEDLSIWFPCQFIFGFAEWYGTIDTIESILLLGTQINLDNEFNMNFYADSVSQPIGGTFTLDGTITIKTQDT